MNNDGSLVLLNGLFLPSHRASVSVFDRGLYYGDGLFETLRSYHGRIFQLEAHMERLQAAAERIRLDLPLTRRELAGLVERTRSLNRLPEAIIRLTLTRGTASAPGLAIDPAMAPTLLIHARKYRPLPAECYRDGVAVALFAASACGIGAIKSCNYLSRILLSAEAAERNSREGILLDSADNVTEGTVSNLFLVKNGVVKTPPAGPFVLPGITRKVVLCLAGESGIPANEAAIHRDDLFAADEIFLTNTGFEILPVTRVDGATVGCGRPGPFTRELHRKFAEYVAGCCK